MTTVFVATIRSTNFSYVQGCWTFLIWNDFRSVFFHDRPTVSISTQMFRSKVQNFNVFSKSVREVLHFWHFFLKTCLIEHRKECPWHSQKPSWKAIFEMRLDERIGYFPSLQQHGHLYLKTILSSKCRVILGLKVVRTSKNSWKIKRLGPNRWEVNFIWVSNFGTSFPT